MVNKLRHLTKKFRKLFYKRKPKAYNFDTAKSIGIVANVETSEDIVVVENFIEELKQQKKTRIKALGYIKGKKELPITSKNIKLITEKEARRYKLPDELKTFVNRQFNILLCLYVEDDKNLSYITYMSKANFKIGKKFPKSHFDLMLELKEDTLNNLIEQIKYYLHNITT